MTTTTKSILLSFLCFILLNYSASAQDESFVWAKAFGGEQLDEKHSVVVDDAGNVYSAGMHVTLHSFGNTISQQEIFLYAIVSELI